MRINIVMGFFLPVPPVAGGAVEKTWHTLALHFAAAGHTVTLISRCWPEWPDREQRDGIHFLRVPGYDHRARLADNLLLDLRWSVRVTRALPAADLTIINTISLPIWLRSIRPGCGRVVVMPGRMPKGQYRFYRKVDRVLSISTPVRARVLAENPCLAPLLRDVGYPIDFDRFALPARARSPGPVTIGFIGRLHREKGLDLLVQAATQLAAMTELPPWRLHLTGPVEIASGGSGSEYRDRLATQLASALEPHQWRIDGPVFDGAALAERYRSLDIFCYPSIAEAGETFGVAVAEAMAAGAAPVVSNLACFRDFTVAGETALTFDHTLPDAPTALAATLRRLLLNPCDRQRIAAAAQAAIRRYDFPLYARMLLADFATFADSPATS